MKIWTSASGFQIFKDSGKRGEIYFPKNRFEETKEGDRVLVKSTDAKGCSSYVGKIGGPQLLKLANPGKKGHKGLFWGGHSVPFLEMSKLLFASLIISTVGAL